MIELQFTAALAAMGVRMGTQEPFEAVCWEWESGLGFYVVDRVGDGQYEATYAPRRHEYSHTIEAEDAPTWSSSDTAKRACVEHFRLVRAGRSPSCAAAEIQASWPQQTRKTPTLQGLAPVVSTLPPKGAFL